MNVCDLHTGIARMSKAFSDLKRRWNDAQGHWHDDVRKKFEQDHLQPIPMQIQLLLTAAQRLNEVLERAERELSEKQE
jgi:hypothetical protein